MQILCNCNFSKIQQWAVLDTGFWEEATQIMVKHSDSGDQINEERENTNILRTLKQG